MTQAAAETMMNTDRRQERRVHLLVLAYILIAFIAGPLQAANQPGRSITPILQDRLGLSEGQVRGALGALLVYVRDRLSKPAFDDVVQTIPNAEHIMQDVKARGIVTGPIDDLGEYEAVLSRLGFSEPLASQFVPAVLQALGETGHAHERDILAQVLY